MLEAASNHSSWVATPVPVATATPAGRDDSPTTPDLVPILHLVNGEHYSGAERVQDLLALGLPTTGFDVGFACLKPDKFPRQRQSRCRLHETPMRGRVDFGVVRRLSRLVREEGYQLLHAHTPRTALIGRAVAALTGRPLIYHVHSPTSRDSTHHLKNFVNHCVELACIGGAQRLITVSRSLAEHMRRQGVASDRIAVVPNGVPLARRTRTEVRPAPQPGETWTLGMVALIRPRKGIEVLLEAISRLRGDGLPVRLRVVGPFETPDYEAEVLAKVRELRLAEAIDWVGFTRGIESELLKMDLFVLPSLFGEGLPMVVLEAMASGLPIVSTWVEGIPEAVRDGVDGVLAQPNDPESLATCLRRFIEGEVDWKERSASARAHHAARFSDRAMAEGVAAVYRDLLATPTSGLPDAPRF